MEGTKASIADAVSPSQAKSIFTAQAAQIDGQIKEMYARVASSIEEKVR